MQALKTKSNFTRFAQATAHITGQSITFCVAVAIIVLWAATGPLYHFSDTWQLVINTSITIVTFLMVFLILDMQNRDSEAIQIKLDELIRAMEGAHNALLDLEELEEGDLDHIRADYVKLAEYGQMEIRKGRLDTKVLELGIEESSRKRKTTKQR